MKKMVLMVSILGMAGVIRAGEIEERLPTTSPLPGVIWNAARGIDQAQAVAQRDVKDCSAIREIITSIAFIGIGLNVDKDEPTKRHFAEMNVATTKALGACLTADRLRNPQRYVKSRLDDAGVGLLALVRDIYGD